MSCCRRSAFSATSSMRRRTRSAASPETNRRRSITGRVLHRPRADGICSQDGLQDVAHHDWKRSRPIDLSDEWILAALEDRDQAGKEPAAGDAVADARSRKLG